MAQQIEINGNGTVPVQHVVKSNLQRADFRVPDFDLLVEQKGLQLYVEKTTFCPCRQLINGQPLPGCINCKGIGYLFLDGFQTEGVIQSIGKNQKWKQEGQEEPSTARITMRYKNRLSPMDRITVVDGETTFFEPVFPLERNVSGVPKQAAILQYIPINIEYCFLFTTPDSIYSVLEIGQDFFLTGRIFYLSDELMEAGEDYQISIRYTHNPVYFITDLDHDIRNTRVVDQGPADTLKHLPVSCTVKKSHKVIDSTKFS